MVALAAAADLDIDAVHVNHGLHPDAGRHSEIAEASATRLGTRFRCVTVDVAPGPNLEARARAARRRALGTDALTGHTADDQAETILLALLRGAGASGLSGITPSPTKPILELRRTDTARLCDELGMTVANDPTNDDPRFRRNRVRHELLPLLDDIAERDTTPLIARTGSLLRGDDEVLDQSAARLDPTDARALDTAPTALARRAIRSWLIAHTSDAEQHPPNLATVDRVLDVARGVTLACDVGGGWRVERSKQRLRLFAHDPSSR